MSKKRYKQALRTEVSNKIPNVLDKIDFKNIEIIENPQPVKKSYRRPMLRLVYSMSLAVIVGLVVMILVLSGPTTPIYAKEDEAIMASAISAYHMQDAEIVNSEVSNISVSNGLIYEDDTKTIFDKLTTEIDSYFESVETYLLSNEFKKGSNSNYEEYAYHLVFKTQRLNDEEIIFEIYYNFEEVDNQININGIFVINSSIQNEFNGKISKDEKNNRIITTKIGEIEVKTWVEDKVRVFQTKTKLGTSQIKQYQKDGQEIVELIPSISSYYQRTYTFTKGSVDNNKVIEVEVNDKSDFFRINNKIKLRITSYDDGDYINYNYYFEGDIIIDHFITIKFKYDQPIRKQKRRPN